MHLRKIRFQNQSGQALIESLLISPLLAAALGAGAFYSYRGIQYFFLEQTLQESLLCLDTQSSFRCRKQLQESARKVVLFGEKVELQIPSGSSRKKQGSIRLIHSSLPNLQIKKVIDLSTR